MPTLSVQAVQKLPDGRIHGFRVREIGGMACLVLTAMIWGFAFVSQVQGMASMSPLFFGATRFTLGALSLIPLLWCLDAKSLV